MITPSSSQSSSQTMMSSPRDTGRVTLSPQRAPSTATSKSFKDLVRESPPDDQVAYENTEYHADLVEILRTTFHLSKWRPRQLAVINAAVQGFDVLALLPTGSGKSLCYQIPALYQKGADRGLTVVIVPTVSLIVDQTRALSHRNLNAAFFYKDQPIEQFRFFNQMLRLNPGHVDFPQFLFVTPERLKESIALKDMLKELNDSERLGRFVIDEAHIMIEWGTTFRPDYLHLADIRRKFPTIPILALTASATGPTIRNIIENLGIRGCVFVRAPLDRKNLTYRVYRKREIEGRGKAASTLKQIAEKIMGRRDASAIIYCTTKKNCHEIAQVLHNHYGIEAESYTGDMTSAAKEEVQKRWYDDKTRVVVATVAFGLGVDKQDVRFVFHYSIPSNLDAFYQQTGRAGRDGKPAECILYYDYLDWQQAYFTANQGIDKRKHQTEIIDPLFAVMRMCVDRVHCRRTHILRRFGETIPDNYDCAGCDNCLDDSGYEWVLKDWTRLATKVIKMVQRGVEQGRKITIVRLSQLVMGSRLEAILTSKEDTLPYFGCGRDCDSSETLSQNRARHICEYLVLERVLEEVPFAQPGGPNRFTFYMQLGPRAQDVLAGKLTIKMPWEFKAPSGLETKSPKLPRGYGRAQSPDIASPPQNATRAKRYKPYPSTSGRGRIRQSHPAQIIDLTGSSAESRSPSPPRTSLGESSRRWKRTMPSRLTWRESPAVACLQRLKSLREYQQRERDPNIDSYLTDRILEILSQNAQKVRGKRSFTELLREHKISSPSGLWDNYRTLIIHVVEDYWGIDDMLAPQPDIVPSSLDESYNTAGAESDVIVISSDEGEDNTEWDIKVMPQASQ